MRRKEKEIVSKEEKNNNFFQRKKKEQYLIKAISLSISGSLSSWFSGRSSIPL